MNRKSQTTDQPLHHEEETKDTNSHTSARTQNKRACSFEHMFWLLKKVNHAIKGQLNYTGIWSFSCNSLVKFYAKNLGATI